MPSGRDPRVARPGKRGRARGPRATPHSPGRADSRSLAMRAAGCPSRPAAACAGGTAAHRTLGRVPMECRVGRARSRPPGDTEPPVCRPRSGSLVEVRDGGRTALCLHRQSGAGDAVAARGACGDRAGERGNAKLLEYVSFVTQVAAPASHAAGTELFVFSGVYVVAVPQPGWSADCDRPWCRRERPLPGPARTAWRQGGV